MTNIDEILGALHEWAPKLAESFTSLAYFGDDSSIRWLTESPRSSEFCKLIRADGHEIAAQMWRNVLKNKVPLPVPARLLILEHMRRHPANTGKSLAQLGLEFSKTLANVANHAAQALHKEAKNSFGSDEIDVAIARFRVALSELRFALASQLLTDEAKKQATGKYATAVAMIGRWVNVLPATVARALQYSQESMALGNIQPETLVYRLELLILQFDQTGEAQLLRNGLELLSENQEIAEGSELVEAEVRFRLALLAEAGSRDARRYLLAAQKKLESFRPKNSVEKARSCILSTLIVEVEKGFCGLSAQTVAIPRGILSSMARKPSKELWGIIRRIIDRLNEQRDNDGVVPAAVLSARFLRQMLDGPDDFLEGDDFVRYVEITGWLSERASWNRHVQWETGLAALLAATKFKSLDWAHRAQAIFQELAVKNPTWPLPFIGIARAQDCLGDKLAGENSWQKAAELALGSSVYVRSHLGGRNEVFAVTDARGFLAETFVFKRMNEDKAKYEQAMLERLRAEIVRLGDENRFDVPRSLAIVELSSNDERRWVHVSQRAVGRLVSELHRDEVSEVLLESIVDFLAVFHCVAGRPPDKESSAWRLLKDRSLKPWSRTLFERNEADRFVSDLKTIFPQELRLVRKRDGHASNWLVDAVGRIVAIDLECSEFVPIGYDVTQLIEDHALIPANPDGWNKRLEIMKRYLEHMEYPLSDADMVKAYGWFALARALRLGTDKDAGKQLRRHARELCVLLTEYDDGIKPLAQKLHQALARIEQTETNESVLSHDHRRLSKRMAALLRHGLAANNVQIDSSGFSSMDDVAASLNVEASQLLAVAEHPSEPRFEVRNGQLRALYGHSLKVTVDVGMKVGVPTSLFHGSSWAALNTIVSQGLLPMARCEVHLTNSAEEAMAVGERKGAPLVLAVAQKYDEKSVVEGIWTTRCVEPNRLSIVNPFIEGGY